MLNYSVQVGDLNDSSPDPSYSVEKIGTNPFPGLRPFTLDDSHLFFGREGQVDEILLKLYHHRSVTIMGYSGSGKSSLMFCGLIPVLYGGFMTDSGPHWKVITVRPGNSPIDNLSQAAVKFLLQEGRIAEEDTQVHKAIINSVLRNGSNGLVELAKYLQSNDGDNIFFLIDQFEELFRYKDSGNEDFTNESTAYVNLLLNAVNQQKIPAYISLNMRSDFIGECASFPGLTQMINASNYLVPQMTRDQKRMAIEGPVAVGGGRISQRLVKRLLSDIGDNQDQLPILQHALMRTWDYWVANHEEGEPMDIRHYNAIGRIAQALSLHANEAYDELTNKEKEVAEVLFKTITEKNSESLEMRRPGRISEVAGLAQVSESQVIEVVEKFRKPGRSFLMPGMHVTLKPDSVVELSHESLMRIWTRLSAWVDEEFESALMYKRVSDAAAMYQIGKTGLWRPPDLQLALNWQKKQRPTREWAQRYDIAFERAIVFLDTSRITYEAELKNQEMLQKRMLRRARATAVILGIAALIAILFLFYANLQKIASEKNLQIAQEEKAEATKQRAAAEQEKKVAESARRQAEISRNEALVANSKMERALEQSRFERDRAEKALLLAQEKTQVAIAAGEKESEARKVAEEQTALAKRTLEDKNDLYMLAKAQSLAAKSVQEDDDKNLAGLQAMQGYIFHRRHHGKDYDPYIYSGLYHAHQLISGTTYNAIKVKGPARNRMNSVAVSQSGNQFYAAAADGRIFSGNYESLTGQPTGFENPYPNRIVVLSRDENYLVNGTDSAAVQIFNLKNTKAKPVVVTGLKEATNDIEFLPDNSGFVVSKADKSVSLVNHLTGKATTLANLPYELKSLSVSPDGRLLAGGTWTGELVLIDLQTRKPEVVLKDSAAQILSVRFSPDGKKLAYGTYEIKDKRGLVKMFDMVKRTKVDRQFTGHKAGVYDIEFSPDGKLLASAGSDKRLQMWVLDYPEDLPIVMENNNGFIWDIAFAKGSDYLIAACHESEIRVWPTNPELLANQVCPKLTRNMTLEEWTRYVGDDIDFENTCTTLLIKDYE